MKRMTLHRKLIAQVAVLCLVLVYFEPMLAAFAPPVERIAAFVESLVTPPLPDDSTSSTRTPLATPIPKVGRDAGASKYSQPVYGIPSGLSILRQIDSTNNERILLRERMGDIEVGVPTSMPLNDYLELRRNQLSQKLWDSLTSVYDLKRAASGDDLSKLLSQATGISIPMPPALGSIFGKPEISINVNGEVNIRGGWRWDSQNLGASSAFGQSQSAPIFSQDIQINVSGRIGDKFKIGTDWSTRRQFEYENRFKLGYEGYDDDIIKRLELGNVNLPTNSVYISGSQALFGVRGDFQFGPLFLKTVASQRRGERKVITVNGGSSRQRFVLHAYDYAPNHFFFDSLYKDLYRRYWRLSTPVAVDAKENRVKEVEVYESSGDVRDQAVGGIEVVAYDELKPIKAADGSGTRYPSSMKDKSISIEQGKVERGRFIKLDQTSGRFVYDANLGTLTILNMRRDRTYAVAYRTEGATNAKEDDLYTGMLSTIAKQNDTLVLKLVYRPNMQPSFKSLWARQMRNHYFVNATNVNTADAKINIYYLRTNNDSTDVLEGTSDKIVTALRVDQVNNSTGTPPGDGLFDFSGGGQQQSLTNPASGGQQQPVFSTSPFFDALRGEIIFPSLEPFREGLDSAFARGGNPGIARQYYYASVYDNQVEIARQQTAQDRWLITGDVAGQNAGRIQLGWSVTPGSVRVRLAGRDLRENDDYTVDYVSGTLTLRSAQAQVPGADLAVEYESNDIMNVTTKTLAGIRADMNLYKTRNFLAAVGGTYMHYDQAAITDRVRVGEEPVSNGMVGFDASVQWQADWLTKALDALPFYETKEKSSINLRGEWALQMPTPNKRTSDVPSDNSAAVAYVDDFEAAQRYISLGLAPTQWSHASPPVDSSIAVTHQDRALYRGANSWWQYFIPREPSINVYPNRQTIQGRSNLSPLYIDFDPDLRGIYNTNVNFLDSLNPKWDSIKVATTTLWQKDPQNREKIWGGFQRLLSSFNSNFDLENIDYIEIMMQVQEGTEPTAHMYIDLGQISEDVIANNELNTEDGISPDARVPNGRIDPGEDLGIDALDSTQEANSGVYKYPLSLEKDPARDNFEFNFSQDDNTRKDADFARYNNYENNSTQSELGQFPDSEILNKQNGQSISLDNSYFTYEVNLDQSPGNPQVVGGGLNGWRLYRIPLRGLKKTIGNPSLSNIQYVRIWYKGGKLKARIADWRFAGAQWQRFNYANLINSSAATDNTLRVAFVNREENDGAPDYYSMPPGVQPPRNLANPDFQSDIRLNEQSLALTVENLNCGDERSATRYFRSFDVFYYKYLRFFVKGVGGQDYIPPDSVNLTPADTNAPQFFIRFGIDSANYYEYRSPLVREWKSISIELQKLTAIKSQRDSIDQFRRMSFPVPGEPLARYSIQGNPILTRIQYVSFGIANPSGRCPKSLSTTMWVDELRLLEPENDNDWAGTGSIEIKFADLGRVTASFQHIGDYFHRLEERFGTRERLDDFSINADAGLEKFLPKTWKEAKIPISFTRTTQEKTPRFQAQNDVNVEEAAALAYNRTIKDGGSEADALDNAEYVRRRSRTRLARTSFAITGFRFGFPTDAWYIRETINRLTMGFSYNQESEQSQVVQDRFLWRWDLQAQYGVNLPQFLSFTAGGWMESIPLLKAYKDWKLNPLPQNISLSTKFTRSRRTEQSWYLPFPSPVERHFDATNSMTLQWRISENGLLSPSIDYNATQGSTLVPIEVDSLGRQLTGSDVAQRMLLNNGRLVDYGTPNTFQQTFSMNFRPKLPEIGGINKYFDANGNFNTNYTWRDPLQPDPTLHDVAKQVQTTNSIRINTNLRLRQMTNSWFGIATPTTTTSSKADTTKKESSSIAADILDMFRSIFFDYESFNINFNQQNSANTPGAFGGSGFSNLWGRTLTLRGSENFLGPSTAYMLGLVRYPHGSIRMTSSDKFPFFGFEEDMGFRPPNAQMQDNFTQKTNLEMRTSRPLWKNATLDLSWRTEFGTNRNQLTTTDGNGEMSFSNVVMTEQYNRSFLTLPKFLIFSAFNNSPQNVVSRYREARTSIIGNKSEDSLSIDDQVRVQNAMTDAFIGGLQAFEFFPGVLGRFLPQLNWTFRWEGIEKYWFFGGVAQRVALEHTYQSSYTENARINDNGRIVDAQTIQMNFQPLIGINFTFDEKKLKGNLTGSLRYNTRTNYALAAAARTLSEEVQKEFQMNATYTLRGFSFALLGIELKNDLEFGLLGSYRYSARSTYSLVETKTDNPNGNELDGTTTINIEPSARYTISNRVTAKAFFRYDGNFSTGAANPGYSTTQVGIEIRLAVSGGR